MRKPQKTKVEIINETVEYYSEDVTRRGVKPYGGCLYHVSPTQMCAVGRCLINPEKVDKFFEVNKGGYARYIPNLERRLKPEYRGHEATFWDLLQQLHDTPVYWSEDGITTAGKNEAEHLLKRYSNV